MDVPIFLAQENTKNVTISIFSHYMLIQCLYREAIQSQCLPPMLYVNLIATYTSGVRNMRAYNIDDREIEHATFTPLVLSTTGGMGRAATTFFRRLTSKIAQKRDVSYAQTLNWILCRLSFALLRASIMSIRGVRSSRYHAVSESPIDL